MVYDYVPQIIIGVILLVVGVKLNMDAPIANLVRLGLILIGIVILAYGIFSLFAQFP